MKINTESQYFKSPKIKIASTQYGAVHPLIRKRWSARSFSNKPVSQEDLNTLLEAASWAPSSMNEQPWRYLYAHRSEKDFELFNQCILSGNQPWAGNAAVLLISLSELNFSRNQKPNRYAMYDTGAANNLMLLQAADMDIYGHQMGGFDYQKTRDLLEIPEHLEVVCFIALGYLDEPDKLPEPFRSREVQKRTRNSLQSFSFTNQSRPW